MTAGLARRSCRPPGGSSGRRPGTRARAGSVHSCSSNWVQHPGHQHFCESDRITSFHSRTVYAADGCGIRPNCMSSET
jgi:hypothetical protein